MKKKSMEIVIFINVSREEGGDYRGRVTDYLKDVSLPDECFFMLAIATTSMTLLICYKNVDTDYTNSYGSLF